MDEVTQRNSRRKFLKRTLLGASAALIGATAYPFIEARWFHVKQVTISVPRLPDAFVGQRIALLTDLHYGSHIPLSYIESIVEHTNSLAPDLICITGDMVHHGRKFIAPCVDTLKSLHAPQGVFVVLGNHDHWAGATQFQQALDATDIDDISNSGLWLRAKGERLRLAGVDDLWTGRPDLRAALAGAKDDDCCLLLNHNPDFVEFIRDERVSLVLSGHTHGGQVVVPFLGAPYVPSRFGQKYLHGLVQAPHTQVYVSRGLGTVLPPVRFCCPPELTLITLSA